MARHHTVLVHNFQLANSPSEAGATFQLNFFSNFRPIWPTTTTTTATTATTTAITIITTTHHHHHQVSVALASKCC
jgi:hypothetical protein